MRVHNVSKTNHNWCTVGKNYFPRLKNCRMRERKSDLGSLIPPLPQNVAIVLSILKPAMSSSALGSGIEK
jgi:hypothetical protein